MPSLSNTLIWRAILSIVIGVIAVAWPSITVGAFVLLFAVYAFLAGLTEIARAFRSEAAGPVIGRLLLGALDIIAAIVAIAWPGITALVLVVWVAAWAFVTGVFEVGLAFRSTTNTGERALLGLSGLVSVALGVVLFIRPDIGAITLAQVYGLFSLFSGISLLVMAINLRHLTHGSGKGWKGFRLNKA
jgi:uncharacterized membrane protein HdeD (DUF308 family)